MTMHEALFFVADFHRFLGEPWPTTEQVGVNLRLNREAFPRDKNVNDSFYRQIRIARARHYVVVDPCGPECHAKHVRLTAVGEQALAWMNEHGCSPSCVRHREIKLNHRKAA